jgi:hypothetical protein
VLAPNVSVNCSQVDRTLIQPITWFGCEVGLKKSNWTVRIGFDHVWTRGGDDLIKLIHGTVFLTRHLLWLRETNFRSAPNSWTTTLIVVQVKSNYYAKNRKCRP